MLPTFFLAWIRKNSFDFPKDLSEAIEAHAGALIDWKKQYDEMLTLYEAHKGDWEKFVNDWRDLANRVIKERDSHSKLSTPSGNSSRKQLKTSRSASASANQC